jgi:predicted Zn-dependent protease with MMP-like domain
MTITKQLRAIKEIAEENLHKAPDYFLKLIEEIDLQLLDLESEKMVLIESLEMEYEDLDHLDFTG